MGVIAFSGSADWLSRKGWSQPDFTLRQKGWKSSVWTYRFYCFKGVVGVCLSAAVKAVFQMTYDQAAAANFPAATVRATWTYVARQIPSSLYQDYSARLPMARVGKAENR